MDKYNLADRTMNFAVNVIKYSKTLPRSVEIDIIRKQLIRSSTSVGANYRAALKSRSKNEFISKICISLEESDESLYWLELIERLGVGRNTYLSELKSEADQFVRIFISTRKTARNIAD